MYKKKVANFSLLLLVVIVVFGLFQARNQLKKQFANLGQTNYTSYN